MALLRRDMQETRQSRQAVVNKMVPDQRQCRLPASCSVVERPKLQLAMVNELLTASRCLKGRAQPRPNQFGPKDLFEQALPMGRMQV
jgi:hypothetical protein